MNVVEFALRFTAAWLAVGLGLFIAMASLRALRPAGLASAGRRGGGVRVLYAAPLLLAVALLAFGLVSVVRVVPW